jgi:hypothetical protein
VPVATVLNGGPLNSQWARDVTNALNGSVLFPDVKPWGSAWGTVARASTLPTGPGITVPHNTIAALADVAGMSATWTAVAGRLYKVTASAIILQNTSGGIADIRIATSGNVQVNQGSYGLPAGTYATANVTAILVGLAAGAVTYKLRATTTAGSVNIQMGATTPGIFLVEDIGPA